MTTSNIASAVDTVLAYHERTKHHYHRYAESLGYLDWDSQPDPFRRYAGAPCFLLPLSGEDAGPAYESLYSTPAAQQPLTLDTLSRFFENALAVSNSKSFEGGGWKLRCNPSSGNLHPTEGYVIAPPIDGLNDTPGIYHYAPNEHALEQRCTFSIETWARLMAGFPEGAFLAGLTSIHWREAWKYGERAFRYCNHDVGHAFAALAYSAATLGWSCLHLDSLDTDRVGMLLGVDRSDDFEASEPEFPDLILAILPKLPEGPVPTNLPSQAIGEVAAAEWCGSANRLSEDHVEWEVIEDASRASIKPETPVRHIEHHAPAPADPAFGHACSATARAIIQQRRSAVAMDGVTGISRRTFFTMLERTLPKPGRVPWNAWPEAPMIHLGLFVHRVDGLAPGLYCFPRRTGAHAMLREAMRAEFAWERPDECPESLPLFLLAEDDLRGNARQVSCLQEIAGAGAFSLGMLAEFEGLIETDGAWRYPRLFWEAGMVGQVLYLEAEAAGARATGIGCYFDDPVHDLFGLQGRAFQSLYHFTVGGPTEDTRLTSNPPYTSERRARSGWESAGTLGS